MAASTAEPPAFRISTPASDASAWGHVTIPRKARVDGRPDSRKLTRARGVGSRAARVPQVELHPDVGPRVAVVVRDLHEPAAPVQVEGGFHAPLGVEAEDPESQGAGFLETAVHQPPTEAEPLARRADPHPLDLADARLEW